MFKYCHYCQKIEIAKSKSELGSMCSKTCDSLYIKDLVYIEDNYNKTIQAYMLYCFPVELIEKRVKNMKKA